MDLRGLLRSLHAYQVQYVVFGALAMAFYGYVRNSEDLDIAVSPEPENLDRVAEWLTSIDAVLKLNPRRSFGSRERWGLHKGSNATVLTSLGQIDVVQRLPGMPEWPQLIEEAEVYEIDDLQVPVMNRATLSRTQTLTPRHVGRFGLRDDPGPGGRRAPRSRRTRALAPRGSGSASIDGSGTLRKRRTRTNGARRLAAGRFELADPGRSILSSWRN